MFLQADLAAAARRQTGRGIFDEVKAVPPFQPGDRVKRVSGRFRHWISGVGVVGSCREFRGGWFVFVRFPRSGCISMRSEDLVLVSCHTAPQG